MPLEIAAERQAKQADKARGPLLHAASPAAGRPLYPTRAGGGRTGSLWLEAAALPPTLYGREPPAARHRGPGGVCVTCVLGGGTVAAPSAARAPPPARSAGLGEEGAGSGSARARARGAPAAERLGEVSGGGGVTGRAGSFQGSAVLGSGGCGPSGRPRRVE